MSVGGDAPERVATPPSQETAPPDPGGEAARPPLGDATPSPPDEALLPPHVEASSLAREESPELLPRNPTLRRVLHALGLVEQAVGTALIVVILVLVLVQVAQRYLPGGYPWTGELARLSLVWCTFVMAGYLMAHERHISIQVVDLVLRGRALGVVTLMGHLVVLATCVGMTYASVMLIVDDVGQRTAAAEIPLAWVYVIPMIGFAMTALRAVLAIGLLDMPRLRGEEPAQ